MAKKIDVAKAMIAADCVATERHNAHEGFQIWTGEECIGAGETKLEAWVDAVFYLYEIDLNEQGYFESDE